MTVGDLIQFSSRGLTGHGLRSGLSLLGVTIGVAAVIVLTALGEGARRYVIDQFASLGTNLLIVIPGKTETTGMPGFGGIPNDLTLEDAAALSRGVRGVRRVAPVAMGTEEVSHADRSRQVAVIGTTREYQEARQMKVGRGDFLPPGEASRGRPVVVLGQHLARELFDRQDPIGQVVRVGGWRMRVLGVLAPQGVKLGIDFDEIAIVPVQTAMQMFNRSSLFRILVQAWRHADLDQVRRGVLAELVERHGEEDVTVLTQDAVISTFGAILNALTLVVAAIATISLSVAGIGIMNVMLVAISERTREIGLLKALGASRGQILAVFLAEASVLSSAGGLLGLGIGWGLVRALVRIYPAFPAAPPSWAVAGALAISIGVGVTFGLLPARRATRLDPVTALAQR